MEQSVAPECLLQVDFLNVFLGVCTQGENLLRRDSLLRAAVGLLMSLSSVSWFERRSQLNFRCYKERCEPLRMQR